MMLCNNKCVYCLRNRRCVGSHCDCVHPSGVLANGRQQTSSEDPSGAVRLDHAAGDRLVRHARRRRAQHQTRRVRHELHVTCCTHLPKYLDDKFSHVIFVAFALQLETSEWYCALRLVAATSRKCRTALATNWATFSSGFQRVLLAW